MTNKEVIDVFFSREVEKMYDNNILDDKNYIVPQGALDNYINTILSVPYAEYLEYAQKHQDDYKISSGNITQCSSFSACEIEMCNALLQDGNRGLNYVEIGKLFPDYVASNNTTSFQKFGENQIKTAAQLGLAFEYYDVWFLSCLGYVYPSLDEDTKLSLLARTLLRDALYSQITIDITQGDVNLLSYMDSISSAQTKSRRYSNVEKIASICINECKKEGISVGEILNTKTNIQDSVEDEKIVAGKTLLLEHVADDELFKNGFTIPPAKHDIWKTYFEIPQGIWTGSKQINVIVDKKPFKASLNCSANLLRKQIMQVQYDENAPIAHYLREVLHVSLDYIRQAQKQSWFNHHKNLPIPDEMKEFIAVFAANRNDTIYITTESVAKREEAAEIPIKHQGVKDLEYYLGCFRDISISGDGRKIILAKLSMILSLIEYLRWLESFMEEVSSEIPILAVWEGMYIDIFQQYYNAKRTSTLFSSPFILLNNDSFWKLVNDEDVTDTPTSGKYAMMTFVNVQTTFKSVIIDKELLNLILDKDSCAKLSDYLLKLLKKCSK